MESLNADKPGHRLELALPAERRVVTAQVAERSDNKSAILANNTPRFLNSQ